jgi:hypothetical protein
MTLGQTYNSSSIHPCLFIAVETYVNFIATVWLSHKPIHFHGNMPNEPFSSSELFRLSGVTSQYIVHIGLQLGPEYYLPNQDFAVMSAFETASLNYLRISQSVNQCSQ